MKMVDLICKYAILNIPRLIGCPRPIPTPHPIPKPEEENGGSANFHEQINSCFTTIYVVESKKHQNLASNYAFQFVNNIPPTR